MRRILTATFRIVGAMLVLGLVVGFIAVAFFGYKIPGANSNLADKPAAAAALGEQPAPEMSAEEQAAAEAAAAVEAQKAADDKAAAEAMEALNAQTEKENAEAAAAMEALNAQTEKENAEAAAAMEAANQEAAQASAESIDETFTYVPGGKNYTWPEEGSVEEIAADRLDGDAGWTRIRQAANGQYLAWTSLVRVTANSPIEDYLQWDSATKLLVTNPGTDNITVKIEIRRDTLAAAECNCNPYEQANAKNSPLGLEWDITGTLATVTVGNAEPVALTGLGVKTMPFPENFDGIWTIVLTLQPGAQVTLNQGESMTSTPTWPLTDATALTTK